MSSSDSPNFLPLSPKNHHHYHAQSSPSGSHHKHHSSSSSSDQPSQVKSNSFLSNVTPHFPTHFPHSNPLQTAHHEYHMNQDAKQAKKEAGLHRSESAIDEHGFAVTSTPSIGPGTTAREAWGGQHGHNTTGRAENETLVLAEEKATILQ